VEPSEVLKQFSIYLMARFKAIELGRMGWTEYMNLYPSTGQFAPDARFDAFTTLSINEDGNWNANATVVRALVGFLGDEEDILLTDAELAPLRTILTTKPVDQSALRRWFWNLSQWIPEKRRTGAWIWSPDRP